MALQKYIIFYLDNEIYGMNVSSIQGIENYVNIIPVPNAQECIRGIINLRGDIIPVYSLRTKFSLPAIDVTDLTKLIVAQASGMQIAFEIDSVKEIVEIDDEQLQPPPEIVRGPETEYFSSVAPVDGTLVILLNMDGILSGEEQEGIEKAIKNKI